MPNLRGGALMDLAEVLQLAEAASAAETALELYEQEGNVVSAGKPRALLEELLETARA